VIALFIFAPTIIAFVLMGGSVLFGKPIGFEKVGWLLVNAQSVFLAIGCVAILLSKKSDTAMPSWRVKANKWIGRFMGTLVLLYTIFFALFALFALNAP